MLFTGDKPPLAMQGIVEKKVEEHDDTNEGIMSLKLPMVHLEGTYKDSREPMAQVLGAS